MHRRRNRASQFQPIACPGLGRSARQLRFDRGQYLPGAHEVAPDSIAACNLRLQNQHFVGRSGRKRRAKALFAHVGLAVIPELQDIESHGTVPGEYRRGGEKKTSGDAHSTRSSRMSTSRSTKSHSGVALSRATSSSNAAACCGANSNQVRKSNGSPISRQ